MPTEPQSQPLVSIIVPVYNAADHIARCIESIRRQTYRNLEIILLNDGSKDVSYAVCQSYAGIDRRIVVIDKNNSGVSATRNLGMQEAHGKYFQFVDADDFIQPYATELLVQKAEASHADMVIAHYNRIEPPVSLPKTMRDTVVERVLDPILDPQHRVQTFGFLMEGPLNKDAFACGLMQEPASFYYGVMWNKLYRADIVREHPDEVKENIKKKFQDAKLPLVDEVINLDAEYRAAIGEGDTLRANRNKLSKQIGMLMGQAKKDPSKAAEAEEIKKQVTAQADRLKELEDIIMGAEDRLYTLEYDLFCDVRDQIAAEVLRIQSTAKAIAGIDVFTSLSTVSMRNNYVKPKINEKGVINIKNGRHPVVEKMIKDSLFVANDTYLDNGKNRISVITGPNMAGKSTYMRQTALIVLMAQIGSFVPADEANIGICDRIFTRVGASDDLASGQSTFMVEMTEVANILRNATKNSLLVLDEIGRGTSTFDGLSIAWAVIEHISNPKILGAKTLFATHYHELTELEGTISGVNNYCIAVKEQGDDIVFLRKIVKGGADKSYGIQVAKLAGVPEPVIARAKELVEELASADITAQAKEIAQMSASPQHKAVEKPDEVDLNQMSIFDTVKDDDIIKELGDLELSSMTPIDALNTLYRLQTKLKNRWQ